MKKNIIFRLKEAFIVFWNTLVSNEVDSKKFRKLIDQFYYSQDSIVHTYITDVRVFETRKEYVLQITTHRPGLLIGKEGIFIDAMLDYIKTEFDKPIKLDLKESKLWLNLYC